MWRKSWLTCQSLASSFKAWAVADPMRITAWALLLFWFGVIVLIAVTLRSPSP